MFHEKKAADPIAFAGKKLRSIYLPTVTYAAIFILLNNVFLKLHIYSTTADQWNIYPKDYLSVSQMVVQVFDAVFKNQYSVELLGAMWMVFPIMLTSLFFCIIVHFVLCLDDRKKRAAIISLLCACMGIAGYVLMQKQVFLAWRAETAFLAMPLILFGYLFSQYFCLDDIRLVGTVISCAVLYWLYSSGLSVSYAAGTINDIAGFYISSIAGFYLVMYCSKLLMKTPVRKLFAYAGKHSFDIMALHFLAFKAVNWLDVILNKKQFPEIACFPASNPFQYDILYFLAGMGLPMLLMYIKERLLALCKRRDHNECTESGANA